MKTIIFIITIVLLVSCTRYNQPVTSRVDPTTVNPQVRNSGFAVNEVLEIAAYMMPRLMANPFLQQRIQEGKGDVSQIPKIVILPVKNNTRFPLNKGIFTRRLRSELNKKALGKILFLARERQQELIQERKLMGKTGMSTADLFLTGSIDGMTAPGVRGGSQESYLYNFSLIDTRNDIIIWEDNYVISKIAIDRMINR